VRKQDIATEQFVQVADSITSTYKIAACKKAQLAGTPGC